EVDQMALNPLRPGWNGLPTRYPLVVHHSLAEVAVELGLIPVIPNLSSLIGAESRIVPGIHIAIKALWVGGVTTCYQRIHRGEPAVNVVVVSRFGEVEVCFLVFLVASEALSQTISQT